MKIKVTLERPPGHIDLVLIADANATAGDVADALANRDPVGSATADIGNTLTVIGADRTAIGPGLALTDSCIRSGMRIAIDPASTRHPHQAARPVAVITVVEGPDRRQRMPLAAGDHTAGRSAEMMLLANLVEGRWAARRGNRGSMAELQQELSALDNAARAARADEWHARNAEHPRIVDCLGAAGHQAPLLWSRRPGAPQFLDVRVGAATLASRLSFDRPKERRVVPAARAALNDLVGRYQSIADVPAAAAVARPHRTRRGGGTRKGKHR